VRRRTFDRFLGGPGHFFGRFLVALVIRFGEFEVVFLSLARQRSFTGFDVCARLLAGFVALALSIIGWGLVFTLVFVLFGCAGRPKLSTDCWAGLPGVGLCLTVEQREEIGGKP